MKLLMHLLWLRLLAKINKGKKFLEEKQVLLEAKNLAMRKNKISEILSTYTYDEFNNTTLQ